MEQAELLRRVLEVLEEMKITYMVVGSIASGAYGEPRLTQDIDVVVSLKADDTGPLARAFPSPDYYVSLEAVKDAIARGGQFNVIHPDSGNKIDFIIARNDPWGRQQLHRRQRVRILPDTEGYTARPEDIIIGKMQYYREGGSEKHLRDITGILKVSGEKVDCKYIVDWAQKLGLSEIWQAICRRLGKTDESSGS